jgi:hypothetical protein
MSNTRIHLATIACIFVALTACSGSESGNSSPANERDDAMTGADTRDDNERITDASEQTDHDTSMGRDATADTSPSGGSETAVDTASNPDEHRKVGWIAELETKSHNVKGTAKIVDNRTIEVSGFHYDGQGPAVYWYGAKNGNFEEGFQIGDELTQSYSGETVTLELPDGKTLDDLDGISVWCVEFSVDFGSGTFEPPS